MKRTFAALLLAVLLLLCGCKAEWEKIENWQEGYDLGIRYLSEGNYEEAILAFTAAIEIEPMNAEAFVSRAEVYLTLSASETPENALNYQNLAANDLEQALDLGVFSADAYRMLTELYVEMGNTERAMEVYMEAFESGLSEEQDRTAFFTIAQDAYKMTGDAKYLEFVREAWDDDALKAFGEFLGIDEKMAFAAEDLNWDGIPELIAGPIYSRGPEGVTATMFYSVYVYKNGIVEPIVEDIFMVPVDGWTGPIQITPTRTLISNSHNRVIGAGWYHITWDGENVENIYAGFGASNSSNTEYSYSIDEVNVTAEEFASFRTVQSEGAVDLVMYPNTHENRMEYLKTDHSELLRKRNEVKETLLPIMAVLNECCDETFGAEWDGGYNRTVMIGESGYEETSRLYKGQWDSIELLEGEDYDYAFPTYYRVSNFQTLAQLKQHIAEYISEDLFGTEDIMFGSLEDFEGQLYAVRGGRGYGGYRYDTETLEIVSFDENTCIATCKKYLHDRYEGLMQLTFEQQNDRWRLTNIEKAS